ncbi:MAG: nicotinamide mononucleotide transporter [Bacteroidales bacterium]|nr:nicotinamide mononucleotide transporter [Bacteroidales bacterium]
MDIISLIEQFAFYTGILYVILEILQKNFMWVLGILTGAACAYSFAVQHLYASMGLNIYYVIVSFWGLYQWRKDKNRLEASASAESKGATIHLERLSRKTALISLAVFIVGTALLILLLKAIGDSESVLDAVVTVMSAIATWWLAKSYPQQWLLFIVADILSTILCFTSGLNWMAVLYMVYIASAVYGYYHWMKKGAYVQ